MRKNPLPYFHSFGEENTNNLSFQVPKKIIEKMQEFAKKGLPYEICGILSGNKNEIKTLWPFEVRIKHPYRFFVDKEQVEEVLNQVEQIGEEVLVIYHSHPTAKAIPSTLDIQNHPDSKVLMGIISLIDTAEPIRFFQINHNKYCPFPISIH